MQPLCWLEASQLARPGSADRETSSASTGHGLTAHMQREIGDRLLGGMAGAEAAGLVVGFTRACRRGAGADLFVSRGCLVTVTEIHDRATAASQARNSLTYSICPSSNT